MHASRLADGDSLWVISEHDQGQWPNVRPANGPGLEDGGPAVGVKTAQPVSGGPRPEPKSVRHGDVGHGAGDGDQSPGCSKGGGHGNGSLAWGLTRHDM
jgi:hypothetical protein